ncbi:MAG TPA: ATP-binding protein [Rhizomicrobium sp.]
MEQHDLRLVVLAAFICVFACWSAVSLASRARVSAGRPRQLWILAAGSVFGAGVWATHFVSMLAYQSSLQIGYDLLPTVLSVLISIVLSVIGFALVLRPGFAPLGGAVIGTAVGAMHFVGMLAVEGPFVLRWDTSYIAASLVLCLCFATLAAIAGVTIRNIRGRMLAVALLVLCIVSLHFTAMSAVTLMPDPRAIYDDIVLAPGTLAIAIAAAALLIVALGLVAALLDNHLALRRSDEAARLRAYIVELEDTQRTLKRTSRDLSEALAKASAASDAKSAFLAAMGHELRTPLNAIIGFSEVILGGAFGPIENPRYGQYIGDIHRSGSHLLSLINDVLDLSRFDAGEADLVEEEVSLDRAMDEALHMIAHQAEQGGVRISRQSAAGLPYLRIDSRRMTQVFLNILSNAVKFTPAGGSVNVSIDRHGDRLGDWSGGVRVRISDTGIGIAPEDVARAFERFGQVDSRLSRKYEGTGLGLPIARQLVELHGGTLTLCSQPDAGTTVTITLPESRIVRTAAAA